MRWRGTRFFVLVSVIVFGVDMALQRALVGWGAKSPAIWSGEIYRLITATFLHADIRHLLLNMYALYMFGRVVEGIVGPARFAVVYLLSGAFGYVVSLLAQPGTVAVGASAAIFGLMGYTLHYRLRRLPLRYLNIDKDLFQILGLNLVIGILVPRIDQMAHLGGLLGGMLAGSVVGLPSPEAGGRPSLSEFITATIPLVLVAAMVLQPALVITGLSKSIPSAGRWADRRYGPFLAPLWADLITLMWTYTDEPDNWQRVPSVLRVTRGRDAVLALFWRWEEGAAAWRPVPYRVRWGQLAPEGRMQADRVEDGTAFRADSDPGLVYARGSAAAFPGRWKACLEVDGREVWSRKIGIVSVP